MAKKRWLPMHVYEQVDRHGKTRHRYRRGAVSGYLPGKPGSPEFLARLAELTAQGEPAKGGAKSAVRLRAKSIDALFHQYRQTPRWKRPSIDTQSRKGRILQRFCDITDSKGRFGDKLAASCTVGALERQLGKMSDTPGAANKMRKALIELFDFAIKLGWRVDNPARLTDPYRSGKGFKTWTEEEITAYRETHAYGTMARLVMELALNTAARRENIATLTRDNIRGEKIAVHHVKGGSETLVRIEPETAAALAAMPAAHFKYLVHTEYGKPFSKDGLGNKMQDWTAKAELVGCSLHGLRKAKSRRLAESGASDAQGRAFTGQKKNETFAYYAEQANQEALAEAAFPNLAARFFPTSEES